MLRRTLIAALVATSLAPCWARAQDWDDQGEYYDDGSGERPPDYDVSVDVGVSGGVTFDTFYAPLGAHGEWVSAGPYGRVWRPRVAAGWRPYYYGRWEWTSEGWFWVSDEPWGWAAYHYGRWAFDNVYGWVWIPGYQWAPAWVSWRSSGDVVGWAPLAPGLSVYVASYPFYDAWWTFVPCASFVSVPVYTVAYAPNYTRHYFYSTTPAPARPAPRPIPGRVRPAPAASLAWGGPAPRAVEARIGRPLRPSRVVAAPSPGAARAGSGEIAVYRPERAAPGRGRPDAPGRLEDRGRGAPAGVPGRSDERRNSFAPPARRIEDSDAGPRGWGRPERVNPAPSQRRERFDAAPSRGDGNRDAAPRGWTRPQGPERGGGPPARAPEPRGRSGWERGSAPGGAPGSAPGVARQGGGRGGSGEDGRGNGNGNGNGGGGHAPSRGDQGGGRPASPPRR